MGRFSPSSLLRCASLRPKLLPPRRKTSRRAPSVCPQGAGWDRAARPWRSMVSRAVPFVPAARHRLPLRGAGAPTTTASTAPHSPAPTRPSSATPTGGATQANSALLRPSTLPINLGRIRLLTRASSSTSARARLRRPLLTRQPGRCPRRPTRQPPPRPRRRPRLQSDRRRRSSPNLRASSRGRMSLPRSTSSSTSRRTRRRATRHWVTILADCGRLRCGQPRAPPPALTGGRRHRPARVAVAENWPLPRSSSPSSPSLPPGMTTISEPSWASVWPAARASARRGGPALQRLAGEWWTLSEPGSSEAVLVGVFVIPSFRGDDRLSSNPPLAFCVSLRNCANFF